MTFKNVTVAGSGVLGYQIAFQTAFYGFNVTVYDINDEVLEKAKAKFDILAESYKKDLKVTEEQLAATKANLQYNSNLAEAVQDADLLIEAVPENPQIKIGFYEQLAKVAPAKTVFATNSSTMLPSQFAEYTGRPAQFVALHFANEIWKHNTGEVMKHPGTSDETFNSVLEFAKQIGMVALPIYKEQPGYIVNSLLVPLLSAALDLYVNEVADVETIDKTWMVATGAPVGPFGILDVVGVTTAYNINKMAADKTQNPTKIKVAAMLKENYIDKNKLGVATGEGFYKYPNPAYWEKNFLK
ncbi:3-hydroxyacyl-CoA dehydrogenase [Empedobacter stercoris]|uniref:3-hydroxyacyl-CoA dehydrogenase n=1 Tax=Empedobacter stercoris TaxID=1628248 RepID=A0ABX1WL33_9FLAO|nr:3-hydroxyacyl-CoA dehydrogenase [Empedobacter stercoris]MCA4777817.1 3-hydroxyacyl-CoA dehydrogenase [Empedobacter stercoris]MCA4782616.1 3-hydroxyacyl-CoA dehydrogenase [Empedobacter stercoris]MCA4810049.1 3-hydroxyacyl-CoA dehydrogenase [Empedobacter stercoris]NOJ75378.1 3-hydroxyacyl-CoA dehydrogenase [Empedobacter stercoris]QNT15715.1 3-hydroxyacyl-CoA dehydrogenase [Empedobacter stercoris]